jgi:hypothetical protein
MIRTTARKAIALAAIGAAGAVLAPTEAHAATFDCRTDGDDRCLVRVANADGGGAILYSYRFSAGRPTADVYVHPKQYLEDDRYITEPGSDTSEGAWDCRWDGDDKCVGRLGGVRYVFPFLDGSPVTPYRSAWQG